MAQSKYPVLKDLGLSEGEIEVFEALLSLGRAKASDLVPKTSLKRANLYHVLGSLQNKGLISAIEGKQTVFEPRDPSILWQLFEDRKKLLERTKAELSATLPFIASDLNKTLGRPSIEIFEGMDGLVTAFDDTLLAKEPILTMINPEILIDQVGKFNDQYSKKRIKKGVSKHILLPDTEATREFYKTHDKNFTQFRFLKNFPMNFSANLQLYDNTALIVSPENNHLITILIRDESIAKLLKNIYSFLWDLAKE